VVVAVAGGRRGPVTSEHPAGRPPASANWHDLGPLLARHHRALAVDLAGHGRTPRAGRPATATGLVLIGPTLPGREPTCPPGRRWWGLAFLGLVATIAAREPDGRTGRVAPGEVTRAVALALAGLAFRDMRVYPGDRVGLAGSSRQP
jgi:pimeloyl-ACP methyl ester carboxylesterase